MLDTKAGRSSETSMAMPSHAAGRHEAAPSTRVADLIAERLIAAGIASVARGFGLECMTLDKDGDWRRQFSEFIAGDGPAVCVVPLDLEQEFEPRLKSRMVDDVITTPDLDDMYPFLPAQELAAVRASARAVPAPLRQNTGAA